MATTVLASDLCSTTPSSSSSPTLSVDSSSSYASTPSPSPIDRPFKIIVQKQIFEIDAETISRLSPIFSIMCYSKDFEKMEDLHREIVDEKSADVKIFLDAVTDTSTISVKNLPVVLRLADKYQTDSIIEACEAFIRRLNLKDLSIEEVLTLLLAANEFHSSKDVMVKLIRRLANEEKTTFNRLKLSRRLPAQIYGAVIGANLNLCQIREVEQMNGHWLQTVGSKTRWYRAPCEFCKQIMDCGSCSTCRKTMCKMHVGEIKCPDAYGSKMLSALRANIVELDWD